MLVPLIVSRGCFLLARFLGAMVGDGSLGRRREVGGW
jgi:hypothetical protein